MKRGIFVTGSGTEVGKTWFSRALCTSLRRRGLDVAALKPLETGCDPEPLDATALARACGKPELANVPSLYRTKQPVAPLAATLMGASPPPSSATLAYECNLLSTDADFVLIEGAGGILVPITEQETTIDLAEHCGLPLVIVSNDALGVLSYTLTAFEAAHHRRLAVAAVVLTSQHAADPDVSTITNASILERLLPQVPVLVMPHSTQDDDEHLADLAEQAAIVDAVLEAIALSEPDPA